MNLTIPPSHASARCSAKSSICASIAVAHSASEQRALAENFKLNPKVSNQQCHERAIGKIKEGELRLDYILLERGWLSGIFKSLGDLCSLHGSKMRTSVPY